jgi:hypothetical protein
MLRTIGLNVPSIFIITATSNSAIGSAGGVEGRALLIAGSSNNRGGKCEIVVYLQNIVVVGPGQVK